ncbi:ECF transporter S component [Lachnospiraceae bacterium C1.1]|nr:ECF transporter S component [Lachnospiraceae bacterium C1.1]
MQKDEIKKLVLTGLFMAIGMILPIFTGQLPRIGNMLLPMHIPVFLCALICGWRYGTPMAFILPVFRSVIFGMPPIFPTAIAMAFELAAYAFVAGFLYERSKWKCTRALYRSMIIAMIIGRLVWGAAMLMLLGMKGKGFGLGAFLAGAVFNAIPGIILLLILVPAVMVALKRAKLVPFHEDEKVPAEVKKGNR